MKKITSLLFAVAIASANLLAQGPPEQQTPKKTPEERADNMTKRMTKELSLTPDQQIKAKAIILKREQEKEDKMKAGKEANEKTKAEFKSILTEEQFKKFEEKQKEMRNKRQQKRLQQPKRGIAPPPAPEPK